MHDEPRTEPTETEPTETEPTETEPTETLSEAELTEIEWPLWKRIGFRLLTVYFLLYALPFPLDQIPWVGFKLTQGLNWFWQQAAFWVAPNILGIDREISVQPTGSGDTTFDFLRFFMMVALAVGLTLVWSLLDRKRKAYPSLSRWLVVGCRFYLGLYLVGYGLAKVIPNQMTPPSLTRLLQTYGSSSPMGLAWTFIGFSPPYTIFAGLMEFIPGMLLFLQRTRLLGACLATAVMTNVAMINYCFDVPVKLFSSHLLAMSVALVCLDAPRLVAMFLGNRTVRPADHRPLFESKKLNIAVVVVGLLLVVPSIWGGITSGIERYSSFGAGRTKPALWGIHDVESFRVDGEEKPQLMSDETYWRALVVDRTAPIKFGTFERPGRVGIQRLDGKLVNHSVELDEEARTFTFLPDGQVSVAAAEEAGVEVTDVLSYELPEPGRMILRGTFKGSEVEIELKERGDEELLLITRGYHWINEVPYNR